MNRVCVGCGKPRPKDHVPHRDVIQHATAFIGVLPNAPAIDVQQVLTAELYRIGPDNNHGFNTYEIRIKLMAADRCISLHPGDMDRLFHANNHRRTT